MKKKIKKKDFNTLNLVKIMLNSEVRVDLEMKNLNELINC